MNKIKDKYKNKNNNLDTHQLFDDLDQYTTDHDDLAMLRGMKAEIDKRIKEE